jgi:hypothetical protein
MKNIMNNISNAENLTQVTYFESPTFTVKFGEIFIPRMLNGASSLVHTSQGFEFQHQMVMSQYYK